MEYGFADYSLIFKAAGDETRLKILEMISCGELCACEILESFQISQSTLSYHMRLLTDCGLVSVRRDGKRMLYSIQPEQVQAISDIWRRLLLQD